MHIPGDSPGARRESYNIVPRAAPSNSGRSFMAPKNLSFVILPQAQFLESPEGQASDHT